MLDDVAGRRKACRADHRGRLGVCASAEPAMLAPVRKDQEAQQEKENGKRHNTCENQALRARLCDRCHGECEMRRDPSYRESRWECSVNSAEAF